MNKKNTALIMVLIIIVVATLISHLAMLRLDRANSNISCTASLINYVDNNQLNENMTFSIVPENNSGTVYLSGVYIENNKKVGFIRRYIDFSYKKFGDAVYFTSVKIQRIQRDDTLSDEILEKITSDFLIKEGTSINFHLYKQNDNNYIFFNGKIPRFICYIQH